MLIMVICSIVIRIKGNNDFWIKYFSRVYGSFRCVFVLFVNYVKIKLQFFAADTRLFFKWRI